jgi:ribonuclease Z
VLPELAVLGTAAAVPTKRRNHNGYLLRWDAQGILFDPGEGTQRQLAHAGAAVSAITQICLTHFHGDHCLGVPGIVQRLARDGVTRPVPIAYPGAGEEFWQRLRHASDFWDTADLPGIALHGEDPPPFAVGPLAVTALALRHSVPTYGYRVAEPDGLTVDAAALAALGVRGPQVGELKSRGRLVHRDGSTLLLADFSTPRPGRKMAFVMDTGVCPNAVALAADVDLLVIESTYLGEHEALAEQNLHLTAGQAARIAAEAGARALVLTHFSERYQPDDEPRFRDEAAKVFDGEIFTARDLDRIPMPPRQ